MKPKIFNFCTTSSSCDVIFSISFLGICFPTSLLISLILWRNRKTTLCKSYVFWASSEVHNYRIYLCFVGPQAFKTGTISNIIIFFCNPNSTTWGDKTSWSKFMSLISPFSSYLQVWLRNRLRSAGLEPVLSHTEKLYIT